MDLLDSLLQAFRLETRLFYRGKLCGGGWVVDEQYGRGRASFHLLVSGEAWLHMPDLAAPCKLAAGDLVIFPTDAPHALRVAGLLRQSGLRVLVYPDADKIGKQIKYADSLHIPFVAILGGNEIEAGTVTVKNLTAQTQATYDQAAAGAAILEGLKQRG